MLKKLLCHYIDIIQKLWWLLRSGLIQTWDFWCLFLLAIRGHACTNFGHAKHFEPIMTEDGVELRKALVYFITEQKK